MLKILSISLLVLLIFSINSSAQKKTAPNIPKSGVVKVIKGNGKDIIKIVKLDPATNSATVTGTVLDPQKDGTVYFSINLRKGQRLIITPDAEDMAIETYIGFSPLDSSASGTYELKALKTGTYSIVARAEKIGENYMLIFKLK